MRLLFFNNGSFALGLTLGIFATLILLIGTGTFFPNLISDRAILGAVVGGFIAGGASLAVTVLTLADSRQREAEEQLKREQGLQISTLLKSNKFKDAALVANRHFKVLDRANVLYLSGRDPIWQPVRFRTPNAQIVIEEKAHALVQSADICNQLVAAQEADSQLWELMNEYERRFDDLIRSVQNQDDVQFDGQTFSGAVSISRLTLLELDDLRKLIIRASDQALPSIDRIVSHYSGVLSDEHGMSISVHWDRSAEPTISSSGIR